MSRSRRLRGGPVGAFWHIRETTGGSSHRIDSAFSHGSGNWTLSLYAKAHETATRYLTFTGFGIGAANECPVFDLTTGTVDKAATNDVILDAGIEPVAGHEGWYRCWAFVASDGSDTWNIDLANSPTDNDTPFAYSGDGESGVYIAGAQMTAGHALMSYIPTYGALATREADSLSFPAAIDTSQPLTVYLRRIPLEESGDLKDFEFTGGARNDGNLSLFESPQWRYVGDGSGATPDPPLTYGSGDLVEQVARLRATELEAGLTVNGSAEATATMAHGGLGLGGVRPLHLIELGTLFAFEVFSGDRDLTYCRANRGDLFSFRPSAGDTVEAASGTFSRASAASYLAKNPASPPPVPAKLTHLWLLDEVYPGGRIPDRIGDVALINGVDDAVGTSDATPIRGGVALQDGDFLRPETAVDVRTAFVAGTVPETNDYLLDVRGPSGEAPNAYLAVHTSSVGTASPVIRQDGVQTTPTQENLVASADPTFAGIELDGLYSTQFTAFSRHSAILAGAEGHFLAVSDQQMTEAEWEEVRQYAIAVLARRGIYMDPPTIDNPLETVDVIND